MTQIFTGELFGVDLAGVLRQGVHIIYYLQEPISF